MWPYPWTHVGTPSHLGHMDRVAATMPSQAHAGAAQEAPDIGQWEGQDVPWVRPSSCNVKGGIPSSRRYLPTYLGGKECSFGVHGAYVDGVVLPALPQAEAELFVWCVQRPCLAGQNKIAAAPIALTFPPVKQRQMKDSLRLRNQDYLHVLCASQVALQYAVPKLPCQASKLKELHPFS